MDIIVKGIVSSGLGEGKYFTQLDWVVDQFRHKLGFVPYPGTLNVDVVEADRGCLLELRGEAGILLEPADQAFCVARCFAVIVEDKIRGTLVIPEKTQHPSDRLEIMAPVNIKQTLGIKDGDQICLTIKTEEET